MPSVYLALEQLAT